MISSETEVCICNSKSAGDIATLIKENDLKTLKDVLENGVMSVGDKCESCLDEGFNNDGINIPLVLALVNRGEL